MNHFSLFAHGGAFDVDAYLAATKLSVDYVWRRGGQLRDSCVESRHPTSGVEIVLGDGCVVPFFEQEEIAIAYLKDHRDELRTLAHFSGIETFVLGLQYALKLDNEGDTGFCLGPSPQLMWHALDVGVRPTYYVTVTLDRPG